MEIILQYLKLPHAWVIVVAVAFGVMQLIGEILTFKGKVVPEILSIRSYIKNRKERKIKEREVIEGMQYSIKEVTKTMQDMKKLVSEFEQHYSKDNIMQRDMWMKKVNDTLSDNEEWRRDFSEMLSKTSQEILEIRIEDMRSEIINFASYVADENNPVTREQFNRFFKTYRKYESIIEENEIENGEVDVACRIATESYENHLKHHSFIEDLRGYEYNNNMFI